MVILTAAILFPFEQLPFNFFYQKLFEWKKKRSMYHLTNREALTVLCSVVKHAGSGQSTKEVQGETLDYVSCFSLHFFRALAASCVLYNRTEHSQGFSICFIIKNPLNSLSITFNFQNKLYFQSEQQCRQHALYSHKARYNKPIRVPVRMVQII